MNNPRHVFETRTEKAHSPVISNVAGIATVLPAWSTAVVRFGDTEATETLTDRRSAEHCLDSAWW